MLSRMPVRPGVGSNLRLSGLSGVSRMAVAAAANASRPTCPFSVRPFSSSGGRLRPDGASGGGANWKREKVPGSPHVYAFRQSSTSESSSSSSQSSGSYILSLLDTVPPHQKLAIGTSTQFPPTPSSFSPNPDFMPILHKVFSANVAHDPAVKAEGMKVVSGMTGMGVGSAAGRKMKKGKKDQKGGKGGGGEEDGKSGGGWIHIADERNVADWARVPDVDDIIASVEVDGEGNVVVGGEQRADENGNKSSAETGARPGYQPNEMYRIVTKDGILGMSSFMKDKLVARLKELEKEKSG